MTGWPRQWARPSSPARTPAWNPLGGGLDPIDTTRLEKTAARHGATVQQVALAALLAASPVMLPIPGTGRLAHLEENVAAASLRLTPEDIASLAG